MLLKWLGIGLLFAGCNLWGVFMAARHQARAAILTGAREMVADMRSGMGALRYTPEEWLESYRQRSCHSFIAALLETVERETRRHPSDSFPAAWDRAVTDCAARHGCASVLRADDVSALRRVGAAAGAGDAGTLIENLAYAGEWVGRQQQEAAEECGRKRGMFLRMGFLLGLAMMIILA